MQGSSYSGRRFRRALTAFFVGRAIQALATVSLILLTVRALDRTEYGTYMLLWALIELAVPITSLGLLPAVQQFLPRLVSSGTAPQIRSFVRGVALARSTLIGLFAFALFAGWETVAGWFGIASGASLTLPVFVALLCAVLASRFNAEMIESLLEQRDSQTVRALQSIGRLCGLLALWAAGNVSLATLLWVDLLIFVAGATLGSWFLRRRLLALGSGAGLTLSLQEVLRFAVHMSVSQLLGALGGAPAIRLMVGRMLGVELAGAFAFLQQLVLVGQRYLPSVLLGNMIRPMLIARHEDGQHAEVATGFGLLWKVNLGLVLGVAVLTAAGGDDILRMASAGVAANAGPAMTLLVLGLLATGQYQVTAMALQVYRNAGKVALSSTLAPLALPLAALGGQAAGLTGVAAGVALAKWLQSIAGLWLLQRQPLCMDLDRTGLLRISAVALAAGGAGMTAAGWVGGLAAAALSTMVFSVSAAWLRPFTAAEGALIARGLGKRFSFLKYLVRRS